MGNIFSQCTNHSQLSTIITNNSSTQRENMATWYRVNIAVTDVYEIINTLGNGRMGEVYHVRRKDGGRTHTEETKRKEEENSMKAANSHYHHADDDLDSSRGSRSSARSGNSTSPRNSPRKNSLDISGRSFNGLSDEGGERKRIFMSKMFRRSSSNSLNNSTNSTSQLNFSNSPSSLKNSIGSMIRSISTNSLRNMNILDKSNNNKNDDGSIKQTSNSRKEPPDLNKVEKPKGILKTPKHTSTANLLTFAEGNNHSNGGATGMTKLVIGTSLKYDDDDDDDGNDSDESIPMNMNVMSAQDPTTTKTTDSNRSSSNEDGEVHNIKDENSEKKEIHPSFAENDDVLSILSEVTQTDDDEEEEDYPNEHGEKGNGKRPRPRRTRQNSVLTGDDPSDKNKKEVKKWVPRRRVFFRRHYACKTIATEQIKKGQMEELVNEIYMMRKMDHPYIIRLYEVYQVDRKIWLVMDYCSGGDLHSRRLNEQQVTVVAEQILRGVAYLHRRGICHRDLKMENIMYENNKPDSSIRLIDFGLSLTYDRIDSKQKFVGAAYTLSPEVLKKKPYTEKSDIWSIGVIIWIMLAGDYPFIKEYDDLKSEALKKKLLHADYNFGITWRGRGITEFGKEFVKGCLRCNPDDRWSALQALEYMQDIWIPKLEEQAQKDAEANARIFPQKKNETKVKRRGSAVQYTKRSLPPPVTISATVKDMKSKELILLDKDVLADIKRFSNYSLFKKTILVTMANTMDHQDVGEVRELFLMIDTTQSGTITLPELKAVLSKVKVDETLTETKDEEIEKLFAAIDYDRSGEVHYAEFLAALAESQGLITYDRLEDSFDRIDRQGKGFISHDDLRMILGENYTKDTVDEMIEEGDFKKNGQVDFEEFIQLMIGDDN